MTGTVRLGATVSSATAVTPPDRRLSAVSLPGSSHCPAAGSGRLLIAATPLGRPDDASARLVSALSEADVVAAEDTRRVRALAQALGVRLRRVVSFFDQNEDSRVGMLVAEIADGASVLLVSDAGMPLVSDPGYRLVVACTQAKLPVTCLPGPSAVTAALAVSALPADKFCFEGFAPRKHGARAAWLGTLAGEQRTCVFFESPRRLSDCLKDAVEHLGADRRAVVCRELTKTHEEIVRGTLAELANWAADGVLGEITVVLAGAVPTADLALLISEVEALVTEGMRVKDACAQVVAASPGAPARRELYDAVLRARR